MALIWRPGKASRGVLILIATLAVMGYLLVEGFPQKVKKPHYSEKMRASRQMEKGMEAIRQARLAIFGRINPETDPAGTGMIGDPLTPITSKAGKLSAKQAAANPNFAALLVQFYKKAGLKEGDVVALAFSGSFPSLNLAALAAAETLKLKPVPIVSLSASQFGANNPELTWLDMERILFEKGIIRSRSVAVSLGGHEDRGKGLSPEGVRLLREAIQRNPGVEFLDPATLGSSIDLRMNVYQEAAGDKPIAAYVNIGGGIGSVGSPLVKQAFKPGLNISVPEASSLGDSVMTRMAKNGVPVIHLVYIEKLARQHGILIHSDRRGKVGEGRLFLAQGYNMALVWGVLLGLCLLLFLLLRLDFRTYMLRFVGMLSHPRKRNGQASPP